MTKRTKKNLDRLMIEPAADSIFKVNVVTKDVNIHYKYNEAKFLAELQAHVDGTYEGHYSGEIQTVEFIMSKAETLDYLRGNAMKYLDRYGDKEGYNDKDLYKCVHYLMMMSRYKNEI